MPRNREHLRPSLYDNNSFRSALSGCGRLLGSQLTRVEMAGADRMCQTYHHR